MRVQSKKHPENIQELTIDEWAIVPPDVKKRFTIIESDQKPTKHPMQFPEQIKTIKNPVKKTIKR